MPRPRKPNALEVAEDTRVDLVNELIRKEKQIEELREAVESLLYQHCSKIVTAKGLALSHNFLSANEAAFDVLGWDGPTKLVPELECDVDGCRQHATCGLPGEDRYYRVCKSHFRKLDYELRANKTNGG